MTDGDRVFRLAAPTSSTADSLLNGSASAWIQVPTKRISLNRTPPLFETDEPAASEISTADVRISRTPGKLVLQLTWRDATQDTASLVPVPNTPPETRFRKVQTESDDRFSMPQRLCTPKSPTTAR